MKSLDNVEIVLSFNFSDPETFKNIPNEYLNEYFLDPSNLLDIYNHTKEILEDNDLETHEYRGKVNGNNFFLLVGASNEVLLDYCIKHSIKIGGKLVHKLTDVKHSKIIELTKSQRLHLIENIIQTNIKLKYIYLEEFQSFIDKYPYHDPLAFETFYDTVFPKILSWRFVKTFLHLPSAYIIEMNKYFGEEISFYFLFIRFYTWCLLTLLIVAVVVFGIVESFDKYHISAAAFSIIVAILSSFFLEFWKRYSSKYSYKWNMDDYTNQENQLPSFKTSSPLQMGIYHNSDFIDEPFIKKKKIVNMHPLPESITKYFSKLPILGQSDINSKRLWLLLVVFVSGISLLIIPTINISLFTLRIVMKRKIINTLVLSGVGSIINAVSITIFNKIYERVSRYMTDRENHRIQTSYNSSYTTKLFMFQFVNSFTSLFYIAFVKNNIDLWGRSNLEDTCNEKSDVKQGLWKGCVGDLEFQLFSILLVNLLTGVVLEIIIPVVINYAMKIFDREKSGKKKKLDVQQSLNGADGTTVEGNVQSEPLQILQIDNIDNPLPPNASQIINQPWEEQFYLPTYTTFDDYNEIVLQYSYISLFIAASPIAILLSVVNNLIEMKADLYKILKVYRRPMYSGSQGIGHWYMFLEIIGFFAVITNVLLIGFSFPTLLYFTDSPYTILWIVVGLEHVVICIRFLVRYLINDESPMVKKKKSAIEFIKNCVYNEAIDSYRRSNNYNSSSSLSE